MKRNVKRKLAAFFMVILSIGIVVAGTMIILQLKEYSAGNTFYDSLRSGGMQP